MARRGRNVRIAAAIVASALMVTSVGFSWAVVDDYSQQRVVPAGSRVAGIAVGGLSRDGAVALVRSKVAEPLFAPMAFEVRGRRLTLDPRKVLRIDVERMVDETLEPRRHTTLAQRIYQRVTNTRTAVEVEADLAVDMKGVKAWTASAARRVQEKAVDSVLSVHGDSLAISRSKVGWKLDTGKTAAQLRTALTGGPRPAALPMIAVKPKRTERSFGRTLLSRLSERRVYLFEGTRRVKSYPIAVGQSAFPTPTGWYRVVVKEHDPVWTNPHSSWSGSMPEVIPAGPGNPMGSRAIRLDAPGIAFHGTSNDGSVGTAASHGCMRMHEWDVRDLFERVGVGDRVIIAP